MNPVGLSRTKAIVGGDLGGEGRCGAESEYRSLRKVRPRRNASARHQEMHEEERSLFGEELLWRGGQEQLLSALNERVV